MEKWFLTGDAERLPTPALLIYPDRIEENIRRMIKIAGSPGKLRPHVKTHKMSEVIKLHLKYGIDKFKCSTLAEAEMVAGCGGKDILLAMQPVGVQIDRFFRLKDYYPESRFSAITDSPIVIEKISQIASQKKQITDLWIDINNGMNRTGITPGKDAFQLVKKISQHPFLNMAGLHVYDGHIHDRELIDRHVSCEKDFEPVRALVKDIIASGFPTPLIVAGGTPTFPIHANRQNTETSPGTCVLSDWGYTENFPDLDFIPAAIVLMRVVSKPAKNLLCLDLGHKALAAEMPHPRVKLLNLSVSRFVNHSEEHLVIETAEAEVYQPGSIIYGIPWHICPTVARYPFAHTVRNNRIDGRWNVDARDR